MDIQLQSPDATEQKSQQVADILTVTWMALLPKV
jgi:hypothetical protein